MKEIKSIVLPKDNGPHDFVVEWWYFNGHLKDVHGKEYSFMDCFFKVDIGKVNLPHLAPHLIEDIFKKSEYVHFAHSIVTDISKNKTYKEIQNISLITDDSFKKDLLYINYKNAHILGEDLNGIISEIAPNDFHIKNKNIDLILTSNKKPLLEGGHGYVGTPKNGSYYYSFTDLSVVGSININGVDTEVRGKAWMDHQWANTTYKGKSDKWTWFSFQLENGTEIMCVEYDSEVIGTDILIDIIDKDGNQKQYRKANINRTGKYWRSQKTKTKYPLSWIIEIKEADIIIKTKSVTKNQEIIFGQINYWEGPMNVVVEEKGKKVKGKGYMELVGYPSDYNYLLLKAREIKKNLLCNFKKIFKKTLLVLLFLFLILFVWQITKKPSLNGDWQEQLAVLSKAEFSGDTVTVKNVRNFRYYPTEHDMHAGYYDKTYNLDEIKKVWFTTEPFNENTSAAHTFVSFEFNNGDFLAISIEARKTKDQTYGIWKGMIRTYPLIYIAADERDLTLLRANIRQDKVYVYPVKLENKENARLLLVDMLNTMNDLTVNPQWYNTLFSNCTSSIAKHINKLSPGRISVFSWQLWLTASADELALKHGLLDTDLSIEKAREKFFITDISQKIGDVPNYSKLIRKLE